MINVIPDDSDDDSMLIMPDLDTGSTSGCQKTDNSEDVSEDDSEDVSDGDASDTSTNVSGDFIGIDCHAAIRLRLANAMQASRRIRNFVEAAVVENELQAAMYHDVLVAVYARHAAERGLQVVSALQDFWTHWCPSAAKLVPDSVLASSAREQFWDAYYVNLPHDLPSPPPCSCLEVSCQEMEEAQAETAKAAVAAASIASPWANVVVLLQRLDAFLSAQAVLDRAKDKQETIARNLQGRLVTLDVQEVELLARGHLYPAMGNAEDIRVAMCSDDDFAQSSLRQGGEGVFISGTIDDMAVLADSNDQAIYRKRLRGNWRTRAKLRQFLHPELQARFVDAWKLRNQASDKPVANEQAENEDAASPKKRADTDAAMERMRVLVTDAWRDFALRDFARVAEQIPLDNMQAVSDSRCAEFYRNVTFLCLPGPARAAVSAQCRVFFQERLCALQLGKTDHGKALDALEFPTRAFFPRQCIFMLHDALTLWSCLQPALHQYYAFAAVHALAVHCTATIARGQRAREQRSRADFLQQFRTATELARKRREHNRLRRPAIAYHTEQESNQEEASDNSFDDENYEHENEHTEASAAKREAAAKVQEEREMAQMVSWFSRRTAAADTIVDFHAARFALEISQSMEYALDELRTLRTPAGWWELARACGLLPRRITDCATWALCAAGFAQQVATFQSMLQNSGTAMVLLVAIVIAAVLQRIITTTF